MGENRHMIAVYAASCTPRLSYILQVLFGNVKVVTALEDLQAFPGYRINYSAEKITGCFQVYPHGLLEAASISSQSVSCSDWEGLPVFFQTEGDIPFDIFAASFYLISRYEEYLPYTPDLYGRYPHEASLAYREGFLHQPLVHLWLRSLVQQLRVFYTQLPSYDSRFIIHDLPFTFIPTYDVDEAFSYLHKPLWKNVLGFYRDLLQGKLDAVIERGNVYSGRKPDPYDTFSWLDELHTKAGVRPLYFFLTILKRGIYDKNLSAHAPALQTLYRRLSERYETGLHPSWQSGDDTNLLAQELAMLQAITGKQVVRSRNHYLRYTIPGTYRQLIAAGIRDEYSMGYGAVNGFRASYTLPYPWYDLEREQVTDLMIHPFCFMEATAFFSLGYGAEQAGQELQYYHDAVKEVNGVFITLFHNHFLTEQPQWIAWRQMYARFLAQNFG